MHLVENHINKQTSKKNCLLSLLNLSYSWIFLHWVKIILSPTFAFSIVFYNNIPQLSITGTLLTMEFTPAGIGHILTGAHTELFLFCWTSFHTFTEWIPYSIQGTDLSSTTVNVCTWIYRRKDEKERQYCASIKGWSKSCTSFLITLLL